MGCNVSRLFVHATICCKHFLRKKTALVVKRILDCAHLRTFGTWSLRKLDRPYIWNSPTPDGIINYQNYHFFNFVRLHHFSHFWYSLVMIVNVSLPKHVPLIIRYCPIWLIPHTLKNNSVLTKKVNKTSILEFCFFSHSSHLFPSSFEMKFSSGPSFIS